MKVKLNQTELLQAALIGCQRQISSVYKNHVDQYGADRSRNGWQISIEGAAAELAVCKALGTFWDGGVDNFVFSDINSASFPIEVRSTPYESGRLILHPKDKDHAAFVLVTGASPEYTLRGWILGKHGKQSQWWTNPGQASAYFVPQKVLRPMNEILTNSLQKEIKYNLTF